MKYCNLIAALAVLVLAGGIFADPPDTLWTKTYGGEYDDSTYWVEPTVDGGYILSGASNSINHGLSMDAYAVKTDNWGNLIWDKTWGGGEEDGVGTVCLCSGGGYTFGGFTYSYGEGENDFWFIRTDEFGNTIWTSTCGGYNFDKGLVVNSTSDGGFILAGYTWSFGAGDADGYLVKVDSTGDTSWTKVYGGAARDWFISASETLDGNYIVSGTTYSFGGGPQSDVWLLKLDDSGDMIWSKTYGEADDADSGYMVIETSDGGFLTAGSSGRPGVTSTDAFIIKTDIDGNLEWSKKHGGQSHERTYSVQETSGGGYIFGGFTQSFGAGDWDFWLLKTDTVGESLWNMPFGGTGVDKAYGVKQTPDGGYILAGLTNSFGAGGWDGYLVKTKPILELTSPNGGEDLAGGSQHSIEWTYENPAESPFTYQLLCSSNNGSTYHDTITSGIDPAEESYSWTVPHMTSAECKLKIELVDIEGLVVSDDESDDVFSMSGIGEIRVEPRLEIQASLNRLSYGVSEEANFNLYSASGRKVLSQTLEGEGVWEATDAIPAGVYFVRVEAGKISKTTRLLILR